jgi:uroporphyrinogen decarboxylase
MNSIERFLTAAQGGTVDRAPVWLMRQAGRYLPEYQAVRAHASFLEMCKSPDLVVEVSLQPWRRFGMDAVIFFCDILIPCEAMGLPLSYSDVGGPRLGPMRHDLAAVAELKIPNPARTMPFVGESLKRLRGELDGKAILVGFGGAPWTLATYVLAGGSTNDRGKVKELLELHPKLLRALLDKLTDTSIAYLQYQIDAGAQVIQLFDSWAGHLTPEEYAEWALPYTQQVFKALKEYQSGCRIKSGMTSSFIPLTLFCQGGGHLLSLMDQAGADILSIDAATSIATARKTATHVTAIQGNLSPELLRDGPVDAIVAATHRMLAEAGRTGYIANLGHGVLKQTPPEHVGAFVDAVKNYR